MTELEIKESKKTEIMFLTSTVRTLVSCIDLNASQVYYEELNLTYFYKCLTSKNLQKRIFGIVSINEIIELINKKSLKPFTNLDTGEVSAIDSIKIMDKTYLFCWLKEKNILEIILGENIHEEILERSVQIIKLYAEKNGLTKQNYDLLLKFWIEKHESISLKLEKIICELTTVIPDKVT